MTHNDAQLDASNALPRVTIERVSEAMKSFDVELDTTEESQMATCNLNGLPVIFAVLESAIIIRCDVATDASYSQADAGLFLAAHQINSVLMGARAAIADYEDTLIVRTEREIPCAAGLNDEQLSSALKAAVDGVIGAQNAMVATAEEMAKMGSQTSADETGGPDSAYAPADS